MNECNVIDFNIKDDIKGRLKHVARRMGDGNPSKTTIYAGYLNSDEFREFAMQQPKYDKSKSLAEQNLNNLYPMLRAYNRSKIKDVRETRTKRQAEELFGFSSINAKEDARNYVADCLYSNHWAAKADAIKKGEHFERQSTINKTINQIRDDFVRLIVMPTISRLKNADNSIEVKKQLVVVEDAYLTYKNNKTGDNLKTFVNASLVLFTDTLKNNSEYITHRNFANIYRQLVENNIKFINDAFTTSKTTAINHEYSQLIQADKIVNENFEDDNDYNTFESEKIDETTKSWEDKNWTSFDKAVAADLKIYFNRLKKLASPTDLNSKVYNFDTNNECGVPQTMGANFIIHSLLNGYVSYNSVNEMIDDIIRMSQQIPECYGMIQIAQRCVEDETFANKLFTNCANAKVIKTMTILGEKGIEISQSNKSADSLGYMIYSLMNYSRSILKDYNVNVNENLRQLRDKFINKNEAYFNDENAFRQLEDDIYDNIKILYPNINIVAIRGYLRHNSSNKKDSTINLINLALNFADKLKQVREDYNDKLFQHNKKLTAWYKKANEGITTEQKPIFDYSSVNYENLNSAIIQMAEALVRYTAIKNELNSVNAEGNLSSDIIPNNYIMNMMKQIAYGNKEDSNAGLRQLLNEITKGHQYDYNTLFWGVKDAYGNVITKGLFYRDNNGKTIINSDAKKLIQVSLFNGIKTDDNSKSVMYNRMSNGDYFITNILAFKNPIRSGINLSTSQTEVQREFAGYFMRTPSDAPKNFIIQARKYNTENLIDINQKEFIAYSEDFRNQLINQTIDNDKVIDKIEELIDKGIKDNIMDANSLYEFITGKSTSINYNKLKVVDNEDGTISIPLLYFNGDHYLVVNITGTKVIGETNHILYDIKYDGIYTTDESILLDFTAEINNQLKQEAIKSGKASIKVNNNVNIYHAVRQTLLGELNTFIDQLNNLFKINKDGEFVLVKDTQGLIQRCHYNGELIKDGKLTGNFFTFKKLYPINNFDTNTVIEQIIPLYGGGNESLIHTSSKSANINLSHKAIKVVNNKLTLNAANIKQELADITKQWIKELYKESINKSSKYDKLLNELELTEEDVFDAAINYATAFAAFDDMFEGDVKFYKDAQDFLKRAKEVQAGGNSYATQRMSDEISGEIKDLTGYNSNAVIPLIFNNIKNDKGESLNINELANASKPVEGRYVTSINVRNGWKAVTIYNTVRPSKNVANIKKDIFNSLKGRVSEELATKISEQIGQIYAGKTKTNDAQSYITFEEWIRRKYADGTLHEYDDIIKDIYEVRTGKKKVEEINLAGINARIQVQKNFYFDKVFDYNTNTYYPRQIKNAEFVLIPELVKGTDLEKLYDIMMKHDIGQVNTAETSKAATKNILTFWDNDGNVNPNFEQEMLANNNTSIENYYYRFLYKQQDVPQHMVDETNKAGIQILKKVLDNADKTVDAHVTKFFDNYCANIRDSFNQLIYNMGWKINKDGSLSNIEGNSQVLNFNEFYRQARHEAERLGLDENFIEYLTPTGMDGTGSPIMPNYMNNVSSKLESIAQAIFNKAITRQTLPGWHAAQVTQVGHGMKVLDNNGKLKELKYHPEVVDADGNVIQEAYAEVMIPRWSNLIPKDYDVKKLEEEGLDIQIAYRIPTEGKQSVSIIKVVGFLDDVYGSTIMLPDEWVTQTGADFDVDSVYAISWEMYKKKNDDKVYRIKEEDFKSESFRYYKYVHARLNSKINSLDSSTITKSKYKKLQNRLRKALRNKNKEERFIEYNKIGKEAGLATFNEFKNWDYVDQLPREVRNNNILQSFIDIMNADNSRAENYSSSNFEYITQANREMNNARGADKIKRSIYSLFDQVDFMENAMSGASLKAFSVTRDTFNSVNNRAKSILGKSHWITVEYDLNEKDDKGNYKYDINIIKQAYDDVIIDKQRNVAIVIHKQLANSKNNRNVIGELITTYSSQTTAHILDAIKEGAVYNENEYTFGTFKTLIDLGIDYRTAIAFLQQPGISAINEVNNESNSIYTSGSNKPIEVAIKRIATRAGIIVKGKPITDYTKFDDLCETLLEHEKFKNTVKRLFLLDLNNSKELAEQVINLNLNSLKTRLNQVKINNNFVSNTFDDCVFDIMIAFAFNKYNQTTKNIEAIMRCTNPDKFGAKQTIRNTRMVLTNMNRYGFNPTSDIDQTIVCGKTPLLKALYPGFDEDGGIRVKDSVYPYLASFMKYSTIPSIQINSQIFPIESDGFNRLIDDVQDKLGVLFNDEQYREYKQYLMNNVYRSVSSLSTPLTVSEEGYIIEDEERILNYYETTSKYWNKEISRIYGYEEDRDININIKNINNPTKEEIAEFNKLIPVQKVLWIQSNYKDGKGIFEYIIANKINQYEIKNKGFAKQNIRFTDSNEEMSSIYRTFHDSFFNTNPLIRLAAVDLIKYAFIVEGFKFKKGGLSKIIKNSALYSNITELGMNLIDDIRNQFEVYSRFGQHINEEIDITPTDISETYNTTDTFIDRFIRSHSEYTKQVRLDAPSNKNGITNDTWQFNVSHQGDGLIFIEYTKANESLLGKLHNTAKEDNPINYVTIDKFINSKNRSKTLYKIKRASNGVYLIPLNLLERNETEDYSVNTNNNKFPIYDYYDRIIKYAKEIDSSPKEIIKDDNNEIDNIKINILRSSSRIPKFKFTNINENYSNTEALNRLLETGKPIDVASAQNFIKKINEGFNIPQQYRGNQIYVRNGNWAISELVPTDNKEYTIQKVLIGENMRYVTISRVTLSKDFKRKVKITIDARKKSGLTLDSTRPEDIINYTKNLPVEESLVFLDAVRSGAVNEQYYKVELATESDVKDEEVRQLQEEIENKDLRNSIVGSIEDIDISTTEFGGIDALAKDLMVALRQAERQGIEQATAARNLLSSKNINEFRDKDIIDNRKNIYNTVAQYVEAYGSVLKDILTSYHIPGYDERFDFGDIKLYEALRNNPEYVEAVVNTLLRAKTFGSNLGDIMNLPLQGVEPDVISAIERIRKIIREIRGLSQVKQGFRHMFNHYLANEYATNPNVRLGLVELSDTFGDAGWWESWIGDVAAISNKQIQVIVKLTNNILNKATTIDAPKERRAFLKALNEILESTGNFNWDNIIDKTGKLRQQFNDKFIEDRNKLNNEVQRTREVFGINSKEYVEAIIERDEFYANNVHQPVIAEYYHQKVNNLKQVFNNAPELYLEYMRLSRELFNDDRPVGIITVEERQRRKAINAKMRRLYSHFNEDGTEKTDIQIHKADILKNWIDAKGNLEAEYFDITENSTFRETLNHHLDVIKRVKTANPNYTIDELRSIDEYKYAEDWINDNAYYVIDKETNEKIQKAFNTLKDKDNIKHPDVNRIIQRAEAYDDYGNIDPRKLSDDDIKRIKELTLGKYTNEYDSNAGESILIKDINEKGIPVLSNEFYRKLRGEGESEQNPKRMKCIKRINELLGKVVTNNGRIYASDIFSKLSSEERDELAGLYRMLRRIKGNRKRAKELKEIFKNEVEFKTNNEAFNAQVAWAKSNLNKTADFDVFLDIFAQTNANGEIILDEQTGEYLPNNDLYGYILPKNDKYIDKNKTEARHLIEDNLEFVPTEYYYAAIAEQTAKGTFKQWYDANHVYNPYTHKFEPLRIWTTMRVREDGSFKGKYQYIPTYENRDKQVKDEFKNINYKSFNTNFNSEGNKDYTNNVNLSNKEKQVLELLQGEMQKFADANIANRSFIEQGYIPRIRQLNPDAKYYIGQTFGAMGLEYRNDSEDKFYSKVDFENDREITNDMFKFLKGEGYQEYIKPRLQGLNETHEQYNVYLKDVEEQNKKIKENNLKIDNALFSKDYAEAFAQAIEQQVIINAKNKAKNWLYFLQEDLKENEAFKVSKYSGNVVVDKQRSVNTQDRYITIPQKRALESVEAFTHRVIYNQFKERTKMNKYADLARNMTSAKYMILNVTGGIANIGTGFANIMGEAFASDSFNITDIRQAVNMYLGNSIQMIADMYKDTSDNKAVAITKFFDIVNLEAMTEQVHSETTGEKVRRARNLLYGMQSGGEHFMQNSVLFAVLKGDRIFDDVDGTRRAGTFEQYTWKVEYDSLVEAIGNDDNYKSLLTSMIAEIKSDKRIAEKYDSFRESIPEKFIRAYGNKELANKYIEIRTNKLKEAKETWKTLPIVMEQLEHVNGEIRIKENSPMTEDMIPDIKQQVFMLNKKIHGYYDKIAAARIEFNWWGGLVMQYHKHIYPGFMKRFRTKGYYNEALGNIEIGSYTSLARLMTKDFNDIQERIKNRKNSGENAVIASIAEVVKTTIDCLLHLGVNYQLMPTWERNAVKRCLGDLYGVVSAMLMAISIYAMTDDDDEKNNEIVATGIYLADRLLSESQMYTPWGLYSEARTLWSSPIAMSGLPTDVLKGLDFLTQWMFDEDFNPNYKTGLYTGQNKGWVLVKRNIPIYRIYDRLSNMTKNNNYYRINEKALNLKVAKNIADTINPN